MLERALDGGVSMTLRAGMEMGEDGFAAFFTVKHLRRPL